MHCVPSRSQRTRGAIGRKVPAKRLRTIALHSLRGEQVRKSFFCDVHVDFTSWAHPAGEPHCLPAVGRSCRE